MRRISPTTFTIARRGTSREINRQIALNLVRARQPISRAELARLMGVRRGAISLLVNELLDAGLVFEGAKGESKRGRKPMHLHIETRKRCALAVDVNISRTLMMVTDLLGRPLLPTFDFATGRHPQAMIKELVLHARRILSDHPEVGECAGIGLAVSGQVDFEGGRLLHSPTLGWRDVDLRTPIQAGTRLPVVVENSVKACVLAQVWAVRGDVPVDGTLAFVNVYDGYGVGIAIDGKLLRGANNIAGEFGHVPLNMYGPLCSCGQRGCLEAYVAKRAIVARYLGTDPSWPESAEPRNVSMEDIVARANAGEARAIETLKETAYYLGRGFATIVKAVDPRRIYLSGEITGAWGIISGIVRDVLREGSLIPAAGATEILTVATTEEPRLLGAASLICTPAFAAPIVA
jgi:predicted NBD/HSP70 family sugar kinase